MTAKSALFALMFVGGLAAGACSSGSAFAMGSDTTPVCKAGEVYDKKTGACVKQSSANLTDDNLADYAYSLAKADRYAEALSVLDLAKNQNDPVVLNYRGYATRKLGRTDEGISYYLRSVASAPTYAKVREYLGEAYVIKGRLDLAREQLAAIQSICGVGCEEYQDLNEAISAMSKS
jgi:tetratricopeptide (TPR) repeat protein